MLWWCVEDGSTTLPPTNSIDVDSFCAVVDYRVWVNLPSNSILLRIDFSFFFKKKDYVKHWRTHLLQPIYSESLAERNVLVA